MIKHCYRHAGVRLWILLGALCLLLPGCVHVHLESVVSGTVPAGDAWYLRDVRVDEDGLIRSQPPAVTDMLLFICRHHGIPVKKRLRRSGKRGMSLSGPDRLTSYIYSEGDTLTTRTGRRGPASPPKPRSPAPPFYRLECHIVSRRIGNMLKQRTTTICSLRVHRMTPQPVFIAETRLTAHSENSYQDSLLLRRFLNEAVRSLKRKITKGGK